MSILYKVLSQSWPMNTESPHCHVIKVTIGTSTENKPLELHKWCTIIFAMYRIHGIGNEASSNLHRRKMLTRVWNI
jgi:hypothetical protein